MRQDHWQVSPLPLSCPLGRSRERWIAHPAPFRRAWEANLQLASIPSGPSIESSTTNTVHDTGRRPSGSSIHDWTRPVLEISSAIDQISQCQVVDSLVLSEPCRQHGGWVYHLVQAWTCLIYGLDQELLLDPIPCSLHIGSRHTQGLLIPLVHSSYLH